MKSLASFILLISSVSAMAQSIRETDTTGGYAGDIFLPKLASSDSFDFGSHFSPDENSFYFARSIGGKTKIFVSSKTGNSWSTPTIVSFSNTDYSDADPAFSPTGELYFISSRPRNKKDTTRDYDIWKVIPTGNGQWSEPINVKELNTDKNEFYISFAQKGNVYFSSSRDGGYGEEDIYVSVNNKGKLSKPQNLGPAINTKAAEFDPFVTANESGLIFASSNRQDAFGKADLYWSVKKENKWNESKHFEKNINSSTRDFCPYISKDQKYFFYSSMGDIKKVAIEHLPREFTISL